MSELTSFELMLALRALAEYRQVTLSVVMRHVRGNAGMVADEDLASAMLEKKLRDELESRKTVGPREVGDGDQRA